MACKACGSELQEKFRSEIAIHLKQLSKPHVFVFPIILVCLNCGKAQIADDFVMPERELRSLTKRGDAATG